MCIAILALGFLTDTGNASTIGRNEVSLKEAQIKLWNTVIWNNALEAQKQQTARQPIQPTRKVQSTSNGTGRCGGNLPPCSVMMCESGGNLTAQNRSGASGKWQIMPGTWNHYGGYANASDAPESVQDERAAQIYNGGQGRNAWVC